MEADVNGKHVVVLGLREGDLPGQATWNEIRALRARKPGVVVFAPHPFYPHPSCLNSQLDGNDDCIDAGEWCALHVGWLPDRINPNLRAARWAQRFGKPLLACSDAHSIAAIARNASTVEAEALTEEAILEAVRAGRITFPRQSLNMGDFLYRMSGVLLGQRRHVSRWLGSRLNGKEAVR
jgi:predicted metal-dependent phosphoesterase TrpH